MFFYRVLLSCSSIGPCDRGVTESYHIIRYDEVCTNDTIPYRGRRSFFIFFLFPSLFICIRIVVIFFSLLRAHLFIFVLAPVFVLAPLSEASDGGRAVGPAGSRCRMFRHGPCSVSSVATLLNFLGLGHTQGKSPRFRPYPRVRT